MSNKLEKYNEKKLETVAERPVVAPRVDIFENDNELLLVADVPGVSKESLKVHLDHEELTIEGQVQEDAAGGAVLGREYRPLDYRRSFVVPSGIDGSEISAELNNGVLKLHLPKAAELKPREIQVRGG